MSTWFFDAWDKVEQANREALWCSFAEDLFEEFEGGKEMTPEIRSFLHDRCINGWPGMVGDGDTASRLLAMLMEEDLLPEAWKSYETFGAMIRSDDPRRRYRAVEAMWISNDSRFVRTLTEALSRETVSIVKDFMCRAHSTMESVEAEDDRPRINNPRSK